MSIEEGLLELQIAASLSDEAKQAQAFADTLQPVRDYLASKGYGRYTPIGNLNMFQTGASYEDGDLLLGENRVLPDIIEGVGGPELGDVIDISEYFGEVEVARSYAFLIRRLNGAPEPTADRRLNRNESAHTREFIAVLVHEDGMEVATGTHRQMPLGNPHSGMPSTDHLSPLDPPVVEHLDPAAYSRGDSMINVMGALDRAISRVPLRVPQSTLLAS